MEKKLRKIENNIWKPEEEGDSLKGVVKAINPTGIYGFQVTIERDDDKRVFLTPNQKVLQNLLVNGGISVGQYVEIVFTHSEKAKVKGQSPTMMYELYVEN